MYLIEKKIGEQSSGGPGFNKKKVCVIKTDKTWQKTCDSEDRLVF